MHDRRLNDALTRLHEPAAANGPRPEHRRELEGRLVSRYRTHMSRKRRWLNMLNPWNRTGKFALVALALMILGVGACTTSTTTEVDVGKKMTIGLTAKTDADLSAIDTGLAGFLDSQPDIENVSFSVNEMAGGPTTFEVVVWGQNLDEEALVAEMRRKVPGLKDADIGVETLTGTFEESLASRMKRQIFQMEVDGATAEEIQAQVLAQLAAQGVAGEDVQVEVTLDDGKTEVKVEVNQDEED